MKIDKLKNKIDNQYRLYLSEDNEFDLFALENMLIELMNIDTSFDYYINYTLVLLSEPILDYEKAIITLENCKNDIRAFLISCYIKDWYFEEEPIKGITEFEKWLKIAKTNKEKSSLYYYYSINVKELKEKKYLLEKSLDLYKYNFYSIINLQKIFLNMDIYPTENLKRFNECILFIKKINSCRLINKRLLYEPFFYSRVLGLYRDSKNIEALKQIYFKNNEL